MAPLSFTDTEFDQVRRKAQETYTAIGHSSIQENNLPQCQTIKAAVCQVTAT